MIKAFKCFSLITIFFSTSFHALEDFPPFSPNDNDWASLTAHYDPLWSDNRMSYVIPEPLLGYDNHDHSDLFPHVMPAWSHDLVLDPTLSREPVMNPEAFSQHGHHHASPNLEEPSTIETPLHQVSSPELSERTPLSQTGHSSEATFESFPKTQRKRPKVSLQDRRINKSQRSQIEQLTARPASNQRDTIAPTNPQATDYASVLEDLIVQRSENHNEETQWRRKMFKFLDNQTTGTNSPVATLFTHKQKDPREIERSNFSKSTFRYNDLSTPPRGSVPANPPSAPRSRLNFHIIGSSSESAVHLPLPCILTSLNFNGSSQQWYYPNLINQCSLLMSVAAIQHLFPLHL